MKKKLYFGSLLLAAATVATYVTVNYSRFGAGAKWWLLGFHLTMAAAGFLTGLGAVILRQWWGLIAVGICAYFLKIQIFE